MIDTTKFDERQRAVHEKLRNGMLRAQEQGIPFATGWMGITVGEDNTYHPAKDYDYVAGCCAMGCALLGTPRPAFDPALDCDYDAGQYADRSWRAVRELLGITADETTHLYVGFDNDRTSPGLPMLDVGRALREEFLGK